MDGNYMMKKVVASAHKQQEKVVKTVTQSNHDGGLIPEELSEYADRPLYILIALWCRHQHKWIDRKQISTAFAITERRASFLMSYIIRKNEIIHCQTRKTKAKGSRHLCHEILIEKVFLAPENGKKTPENQASSKRRPRENTCRHEMRWLLSRVISGKS